MKILIAHDGSKSADAALVDLQRAGLPDDAEALVVSVADTMLVVPSPDYELSAQAMMSRRVTSGLAYARMQTAHVLEQADEFANRAKDQLETYFPFWNVRAETLAGTPAAELISKANDWQPDLIVVGSHGRSAISRFILGSVSKTIVTDSDHSVRVSRGDVDKDLSQPPKLVIRVDGSTEAEQAVRAVGRRVWPDGTEVRIIAVDDGSSSLVAWAENELSVIGLNVSVLTERGDPRRVLVEQASAWDADSIFVGGSPFATALITKAHCSVEVIRAGKFKR
ncbi:MAG TPA: universal stress protein [Pyrinomonadaceae bacterium]|nr:universal stress protein [Pyrinomonadaceae bacterium]